MPGPDGMCYDGYEPLPDFRDFMYWKRKLAELQKTRGEIMAGKVEHRFTPGELMKIRLLEHEQMDRLCGSDDENPVGNDKECKGDNAAAAGFAR
ncbi:hypothetical protein SCUCBS95973_007190 [Sporothrix curviconia]|uniref:Uncharacterized protein n=1 Tax=Sporothrix curviconia TaxID=1260050 RepID=A0ABP0CBD5_9PEZI